MDFKNNSELSTLWLIMSGVLVPFALVFYWTNQNPLLTLSLSGMGIMYAFGSLHYNRKDRLEKKKQRKLTEGRS
jgi:hypothetical protein